MRFIRSAALAGATALTVAAMPALAQETTADQPFSGVYVGGSVGYDIQGSDVDSSILFDRGRNGSFGDTVTTTTGANAFGPGFCDGIARGTTPGAAGGCKNDKDGVAYYARVGADIQRGNAVFGVVGEFGKSEIRDSVSAYSTTPASYTMTRELNWEASVRARAGYAFNTTLFYVTGGGGYADIDSSFTTSNTANAFALSGKSKQWGFLGGGGIEQKVGKNFSIGLEYMYHQYNDNDARVAVTQGTAPATNPFVLAPNTNGTDFRRSDEKFRWHSMRATAAFRF